MTMLSGIILNFSTSGMRYDYVIMYCFIFISFYVKETATTRETRDMQI